VKHEDTIEDFMAKREAARAARDWPLFDSLTLIIQWMQAVIDKRAAVMRARGGL